ncbi:hypothetical protein WJX82_008209 [Trebouxia sp. C0006]
MNGNAVPFFPKLAAAKQLQQEDSGKKEGAGLFGRQGAGLLQQQQANSPKIPAVKGGLDLLLDAGQRVNSPSFSPHPPERKPLGGCCHPDPHLPGPRPEELYLLALQLFKAYLEDPRLLAHCLVPGVPLLLGPLLMSGASLHQAALLEDTQNFYIINRVSQRVMTVRRGLDSMNYWARRCFANNKTTADPHGEVKTFEIRLGKGISDEIAAAIQEWALQTNIATEAKICAKGSGKEKKKTKETKMSRLSKSSRSTLVVLGRLHSGHLCGCLFSGQFLQGAAR